MKIIYIDSKKLGAPLTGKFRPDLFLKRTTPAKVIQFPGPVVPHLSVRKVSPSQFAEAVHHRPTLSIDEVRDWIYENCDCNGDSSRGLPDLLHIADEMEAKDRLLLLGELWPGFDQISVHGEHLLSMIRDSVADPETVIPEMMTVEEEAAFDALPGRITIYRGCGLVNKSGCSWTLDRYIAAKVPFMDLYRADMPFLLTATISKHRAAALKLFRLGREVIVFGLAESAWTEEQLPEPPAGW